MRTNRRGRLFAALTAVAAMCLAFAVPVAADETTIGYDVARTAWDSHEPKLVPTQVQQPDFGQLFNVTLPRPAGQDATSFPNQIYAQPLVADGSVIVATEENQIDALDPETGALRWSVSLGPSWTPSGCGDLVPHIGVSSTPVYDSTSNTLYVVAKIDGVDQSHPTVRFFALNADTGATRWSVLITGMPTNSTLAFNAATAGQRPGLLLLGGAVYIGFASHCDHGPYVGYIAGVNTSSHALKLWSTESGLANDEAGIWQSGGGLVSDGPGRIIVATGNGVSPAPGPGTSVPGTLAESVVRLAVNADGSLTAKDYFSPANNHQLDANDTDLGSGSPLALPDDYGTPSVPHVLVQVGKDGIVRLLNRDSLGGTAQGPGGTDKVVSSLQLSNGIWGRPAAFSAGGTHYIYLVPNSSPLQLLRVAPNASGVPTLSAVATTGAGNFGYTSGSPIITSDGATDPSSGVVWAVYANGSNGTGGTLYAFPAVPPASGPWNPIFSASLGTVAKFISPATDNGRVYVGTRDGRVLAFGRPVQAALNAPATEFGTHAVGTTSAPMTVTISAQIAVNVTGVATTGPFTAGTPSVALPHQFAAGQSFTVPVTFTPTAAGSASGSLNVTAGALNDVYAFSLHGTGTQDGLAADPTSVDFGSVSTSGAKQLGVTITNTGTTAATIQSITLPGAPFAVSGLPAVNAVLQPQQTVTASILFTPTAVTSYNKTLIVTADTGAVSIPLTGTGIAGTPHLTLTPTTLDFGQVPPGSTKTKTFVVTNTGDASLTIPKAAVPSFPFKVAIPIPEGQSLAPGDTLTVSVQFAPATARPITGAYFVTGNDGRGVQTLTVKGNQLPWAGAISSPNGCVHVHAGVLANGTIAEGYICSGSTAELFSLGANEAIHAGAATSPWCLDVRSSGTASGTPVQIFSCNASAAQHWQWRTNGTLFNPNSGKCLNLRSATYGTQLQIATCSTSNTQYWTLDPLIATRGAVSSGVGALYQVCLYDRGGSSADGTAIETNRCALTKPGVFVWWRNTLRVLGKCVTPVGSGHSKVILSRCTGAKPQLWFKRVDGTLRNAFAWNTLCLNVPGAVTTLGTQVEINTCTTSRGERWTLPG